MLRHAGHKVDVVENGQEAVEAVRTGIYDVVLMDVQMPLLDGMQATERIRYRLLIEDEPRLRLAEARL